jgi:hypothetical protein
MPQLWHLPEAKEHQSIRSMVLKVALRSVLAPPLPELSKSVDLIHESRYWETYFRMPGIIADCGETDGGSC